MRRAKKLYVLSEFEYNFFFNEDLTEIVWWWCLNDAMYRHEYMEGLFRLCGTTIERMDEDMFERVKPILSKFFDDNGLFNEITEE